MSQEFDPYLQWLGISKNEPRPLSYYRLLGVEKFESDPEVISNNADRQLEHLRKYSSGPHGDLAERLITELIKAKLVLLKTERRETYNQSLRAPASAPSQAPLAREKTSPRPPVSPSPDSARVSLASDPAQWDLDSMVPPEPEPLAMPAPVLPSGPTDHSPAPPHAYQPPFQPPLQQPVAYKPVPYQPAPYQAPAYQPYPQESYQPAPQHLAPQHLAPQPNFQQPLLPPQGYNPPGPPMPAPYAPAYAPAPGFFPGMQGQPQHGQHVGQGAASSGQHFSKQSEETAADISEQLDTEAAKIRTRAEVERHRRVYRLALLCFALALVIIGTVVGIVVSRYGLNADPAEPIANNPKPEEALVTPEKNVNPSNTLNPDKSSQAKPNQVKTSPNKKPAAVPGKAPPPARSSVSSVADQELKWPPVVDPLEPQFLAPFGIENRELTLYRYPGTTPRMATIVSRGHTASRWGIDQDQLTLHSSGSADEFLLFGDPTWVNPTLEFEACAETTNMITSVGVLFRCADDLHFPVFHHSFGNKRSMLETWQADALGFTGLRDRKGAPIPPTRDTYLYPHQWTKYSVAVSGQQLTAKRDETVVFKTEATLPLQGRVGLKFHAFGDTLVRVRNIRVFEGDGKLVWEGIPELPPSLAKSEIRLWPQSDLSAWNQIQQMASAGRWSIDNGLLQANSSVNPPLLLTKDTSHRHYYLEIKIRKLRGKFDLLMKMPESQDKVYQRFSMIENTGNTQQIVVQFARGMDGLQIRVDGVTKMQQALKQGSHLDREIGGFGLALDTPNSEVQIEEILWRPMPESFRLFETLAGPLLKVPAKPEVVRNVPGGKQPADNAVAANPVPANEPAKPPAANEPPRNPLADIVAKLNLDPEAGKNMPPAKNNPPGENPPVVMPSLPALTALAKDNEELQKFLNELEKTRENCQTKIKKYEEDYLKAFDAAITRLRASNAINADDRAVLLESLLQDKKDYETYKRYALAHLMLPHNRAVSLIQAERQKLLRFYEQTVDRLFKEKKDEGAVAIHKVKREDPDLSPLRVCTILFFQTPNGNAERYELLGDKTVNAKLKMTWAIDAEKRLILTTGVDNQRVEILQISADGRKLIGVYENNRTNGRTALIARD